MKLRKYQEQSVNEIERHKNNLVHLPTGSGKSVIFKHLIQQNIKNNENALFLVHGVSILEQAVEKHFAGIDDAFPLKNNTNSNLACYSIDTLSRRKKDWEFILKKYKHIYIDEAHNATRDSYTNFLEQTDNTHTVVGFSATPYKIGSKYHTFWNKVIHEASVMSLIKENHLCFPKCFTSHIEMKTKGVKKTGKDFNNKDLFNKNNDLKVYSSILDEYKLHGNNKKAICFAINIEHSKQIAESFNEAGIKAIHVDASTNLEERKKILKEFEFGDTQVLCNVNIFSTGIDIPVAEIGIMARPTRSRVLWIQQVGRLLRTFEGKKFAVILDHGGNIDRLGHPIVDFSAELTPKNAKENEEKVAEVKTYKCPKCYYVFSENTAVCPNCGAENKPLKKRVQIQEEKNKKLKEYELIKEEKKKEREEFEKKWVYFVYKNFTQRVLKSLIEVSAEQKRDFSFMISHAKKFLRQPNVETDDFSFLLAEDILDLLERNNKKVASFYSALNLNLNSEYVRYPEWFMKKEGIDIDGTRIS